MGKWHGGKGSKRRDPSKDVDPKKVQENWDRIFGKKDKQEKGRDKSK